MSRQTEPEAERRREVLEGGGAGEAPRLKMGPRPWGTSRSKKSFSAMVPTTGGLNRTHIDKLSPAPPSCPGMAAPEKVHRLSPP